MKIILSLFFFSTLFGSLYGQSASTTKKQKKEPEIIQANPNVALEATLPLHLNEINFSDQKKLVALNDNIAYRIKNVINTYYIRESEGDSLQLASAVSKVYFNTLQFRDSLHTLYLILLKHEPTGYLNGKVLFYDNAAKAFSEKVFDFNLHALYDFKDRDLVGSNLKAKLRIMGAEIDRIDYDLDGVQDYRFTRLIHNGTYNAIQTTVLTFHRLNVDTLALLESKL